MPLHKIRMVGKHLFQLDARQILAVLIAVRQRLIVLAAHLGKGFQLGRAFLDGINVVVRHILLRAQVLADHPLGQRRHNLSHLEIYKPQKVPRVNMIFVYLKRQLQAVQRPGKVAHTRLFQTFIIIIV